MHELSVLQACAKPQLFIHGELDAIAPLAPLEELIAQLPTHEHLQFVRIAGAGHFFDDQLPELMRVIQTYVG
jgi:alpha/beta superfamily hydrolase